jgi:hypothetical protein
LASSQVASYTPRRFADLGKCVQFRWRLDGFGRLCASRLVFFNE